MNQNFLCPITQSVMTDPVIGSDGITYERAAIEAWFAMGKTTSPMTRQPMSSTSLVPNYALKAMIEEASSSQTTTTPSATPTPALKHESPPISIKATRISEAANEYHVSVSVPDGKKYTKPTLFIDVLDISGSMGGRAAEATAGEAALFSRADLVRHSVATQIELLRPQDELAVILFDNTADIALPPTQMTATGRTVAKAVLHQIKPRGGTNIWTGLQKALALAASADTVNKNVVIILQTDGESDPSYNPPRGIPDTAQAWLDANTATHVTIHTVGYGFGKALDMPLLKQLATIGRGTVNYIPDGSMVGTVFIHMMANLMSTVYTGLQLQVPEAGIYEPIDFLQVGQSRDFLIQVPDDQAPTFAVGSATTTATEATTTEHNDFLRVRRHLITLIEQLLADGEAGKPLSMSGNDPSHWVSTDPRVIALLTDMCHPDANKGQISKAVQTPAAFERWGRHYLPCYLSGLRNQWAINFKDEASKLFGSDYTKSLIKRGETLFNDLPPPKASYASYGSAPISMSAVNNASGGCFLADSRVKMANGGYKRCDEIVAGDRDIAGYRIRCVVKTTLPAVDYVSLGGPGGFTAWHPVFVDRAWRFPAEIGHIQHISTPTTVYNFVLDTGHVLLINDIMACTLGHDFTGPVIGHSYFGRKEPGKPHVLTDLQAHPGWATGLIEWNPIVHRDPETGLVTGMSVPDKA